MNTIYLYIYIYINIYIYIYIYIYINSKNRKTSAKTSAPHRLLLNVTVEIDLRRKDKYIGL